MINAEDYVIPKALCGLGLIRGNEIDHTVLPRGPSLALPKTAKGCDKPAKVLRRDGLLIHKHESRVMNASLSPAFEERADGFLIIGDKRETVFGCLRQKHFVLGAKKATVPPFLERGDGNAGALPSHFPGDYRGNMLIGKKTERAQALFLFWRRKNLGLRQHPGKRDEVTGLVLLNCFLNLIRESLRVV